MRVLALGELVVTGDDGAPVAVPGAKERLLLGVLAAAAPGVVGVDRLVEVLWCGDPPATARKSLQAHVVRLRTALEPDRPRGSPGRYVARRGNGYALAVDRHDVDAHRFVEAVARGRARSSSGDHAAAVEQLAAALQLWRGEPYADWPDAPFAQAERSRLGEVRAGAVTALAEARLALGHHAELVPELERLVDEDPLLFERVLTAANGAVLVLGRSARLASAAQRRALGARDGGCVVPGCTRPPNQCDAHHVTSWVDGGRTDVDELVLLCGPHHSAVHAGHLAVRVHHGLPRVRLPACVDPEQR